jgi:hypothetical protein
MFKSGDVSESIRAKESAPKGDQKSTPKHLRNWAWGDEIFSIPWNENPCGPLESPSLFEQIDLCELRAQWSPWWLLKPVENEECECMLVQMRTHISLMLIPKAATDALGGERNIQAWRSITF